MAPAFFIQSAICVVIGQIQIKLLGLSAKLECRNHGSISRVDAQTKDELVLLCGVAESMSGN